MTPIQKKSLFVLLIIASLLILILTIFDIFYDYKWQQSILAIYGIILIASIVLVFIETKKKKEDDTFQNLKEFENAFKQNLSHFQCPNCNKRFSLNKSEYIKNNKTNFSCPSCGSIGKIIFKSS